MRPTLWFLLIGVFSLMVANGSPRIPFQQVQRASATPSLSGAMPANVPNGSFAGEGLGDVGTPPANSGFESAAATVGTPPSNHGFETGDFTDWTLTGSPTVQSGGPNGYFARLGSGQKVLSSAFTVDSSAQVLTVRTAGASSYIVRINIYSGATYSTKTTKQITCSSSCSTWTEQVVNAVPYQGDSIKIEVERASGTVDTDLVGVGTELVASWAVGDGTKVSVDTSNPSDHFLKTTTTATSAAFTVDSMAQNLECRLRIDGTGSVDLRLMSGTGYTTSTTVLTLDDDDISSWTTVRFGIGARVGESLKLRIAPNASTKVEASSACIQKHVVGGWDNTDDGPLVLDSEDGMPFAKGVDKIESRQDGQASYNTGGLDGTWYRIGFRLYANINGFGQDSGSGVLAHWKDSGGTTGIWGVSGKEDTEGGLYWSVEEWHEDYFFVPASVTENGGHLVISTLGTRHKPDIAYVEAMGGPANTRTNGNPDTPESAFPPGVDDSLNLPGFAMSDPVSVFDGDWSIAKTDLAVPSIGVPLQWTRTYSAQAPTQFGQAMGTKWTHNWEMSIKKMTNSRAVVRMAMGSTLLFSKDISGDWHSADTDHLELVENIDGSWELTTHNQLVHEFNTDGEWTSVTDRNGNVTTLTYSSGKLTTITDVESGRALTLSYTGDRLTAVSDGTRSVGYSYTSGKLTTITDVMSETVSYTYAGNLVTSATDASGRNFLRNEYDLFSRVVSQLDAANGETVFEYDTPGIGATRVTDQRGKQTTTYFDESHRVTDIVDDDGGVVSFTYDSSNNLLTSTNQLGETWTYTYDSDGNVLTVTDPLSKTWTYTYNGRNDIVTVTDPLSNVTTFGYDGDGNLTSVTDDHSEVTTFTVNTKGLVTAVTDPLSQVTSFGYDAYDNRTSVTNALSKVWDITYDGLGRVTEVEDPLGHSTTYTYNAANLVLTVTDELSNVTTYTYDENGNVLTVEDANNNVTTYEYDERGLLVSILDAEDGEWLFDYDEVGNLVSKTNPRGMTTAYTYDDLSRLESETDPMTFVRSYTYDAASRLVSRTDPKSQSISYTYNDRNELTLIDYPTGADTTFAYNDAGVRTQMVDATGTTTYAYDDLYRLTSVTFPGSRTVSYAYDELGRRTSMTYPGGSNQVTYGYDAANQLTSVTDWNANATTYAYDDAGRMTTATLPSGTGIVSTYSYDDADRLTGIDHVKGGSTTLAFVDYTLDDVGNRTQRIDGQGTHTYAYDDLYRLTSVTYPGPSTTTYAFDAFGNRTEMTNGSGTTNYTYDDADRLVEVEKPGPVSVLYEWDDNGNLVERGSDTFAWDYEDRMVSATVNSIASTFAYRGDGLRHSRTTGMTTTTFTWDIASGLPTVLDDGNQYIYGAAGLNAMKQGGNWYYYLADGLGSTMAIVNASGVVQNSYTYDVYGEASVTGALANEFDFAGQQTDSTGLQYLRARYMDPETGTFLSRDPLAVHPGWLGHSAAYADSNTVSWTDPTGTRPASKCSEDEIAGTFPGCRPPRSGNGGGPITGGIDFAKLIAKAFCVAFGCDYVEFTLDGVLYWGGSVGQREAFRRYAKMGQPEYVSRNKLHDLKDDNFVPPDENLIFNENGDVFRQITDPHDKNKKYLEYLGNILDDTYGSGKK